MVKLAQPADAEQIGIICGLFGLLIGSAINALVWRLKVGKSWVHGRSECPECGHQLAAKDLVPVLSWLWLRGKCRYCRKPIQDHPAVEVATALAFGISGYVMAPVAAAGWLRLGGWLVVVAMLMVLAVYDLRWMLLPDKVMLPLLVVAVLYAVGLAVLAHAPQVALGALEAALVGGGFFLVLAWGSRGRAMGGGDVKLATVMGLLLGLQGLAVALLVAFNSAAIVGVGLILARKRGRRDQIPFGPFLVLATLVAVWWGRDIVGWYLRLNGLG